MNGINSVGRHLSPVRYQDFPATQSQLLLERNILNPFLCGCDVRVFRTSQLGLGNLSGSPSLEKTDFLLSAAIVCISDLMKSYKVSMKIPMHPSSQCQYFLMCTLSSMDSQTFLKLSTIYILYHAILIHCMMFSSTYGCKQRNVRILS